MKGYNGFAEGVEGGEEEGRERLVLDSFPSTHAAFIPRGVLLWSVV